MAIPNGGLVYLATKTTVKLGATSCRDICPIAQVLLIGAELFRNHAISTHCRRLPSVSGAKPVQKCIRHKRTSKNHFCIPELSEQPALTFANTLPPYEAICKLIIQQKARFLRKASRMERVCISCVISERRNWEGWMMAAIGFNHQRQMVR